MRETLLDIVGHFPEKTPLNAKFMQLIAQCGLGWIHDDLIWSGVERTKGVYIIPYNTLSWIKATHQYGLKPI
jgi:hypothetical protein